MESIGIVRRIDSLGRVVVPMELRRKLGIESFSDVEVYREEDTVVVEKLVPECYLCGSQENTFTFKNKTVCRRCVTKLTERGQRTYK